MSTPEEIQAAMQEFQQQMMAKQQAKQLVVVDIDVVETRGVEKIVAVNKYCH